MRKLYPTADDNITVAGSEYASKDDYELLVAQLNRLEATVAEYTSQLEEWKSELTTAFTTGTLSATSVRSLEAALASLTATAIAAGTLSADDITATAGHIVHLRTDTLNTSDIVTDAVTASLLTANDIDVTDLAADTFAVTDAHIVNLTVDNPPLMTSQTIEHLTTDTVTATAATAETMTASDAAIGTATITNATISAAAVQTADFHTVEADFILHNAEFQTVDAAKTDVNGNFYIMLPTIVNGNQRIVATYEGSPVLSVEHHNEVNNHITYISKDYQNRIPFIVLRDNKLYIQCNSRSQSLKLYYIADSYESTTVPTVWSGEMALTDGDDMYEVIYLNVTKFWRPVETPATSAARPLHLTSSDDYDSTVDADGVTYDTTEELTADYYKPDQSVNTDDDVEHHSVTLAATSSEEPYVHTPNLFIGPRSMYETVKSSLEDYALVITEEETV